MTSRIHQAIAFFPRLWAQVPLREQGLIAAALPMVAVVFSAAMAFVGHEERARTEGAVRRHFSMIENLADLHAHLLDAETGLRGSLLAQRAEFLQPYDLAKRALPEELKTLQHLVEGEPGAGPRQEKLVRLAQIRQTVEQEMKLLEKLRAFAGNKTATSAAALDTQLAESKTTMDTLRSQVHEMRAHEESLLAERLTEIRHVRQRDYFIIAGALFLGLASRVIVFWLFNRRVARGIRHLIENVQHLSQGKSLVHLPSTSSDDLGQLERAVADLEKARA
ncbi:MAG: CHASE3 domain-containing protein [Chthoniobacterales bacterium]